LKERLERMLGPTANDVWASTFHSACVKILRRDIESWALTSFTIYDSADSERVVKDVLKDHASTIRPFPPGRCSPPSPGQGFHALRTEYLAQCEKAGISA
jgi:DNA helicase-2/ATP-dependent DNA helicase PcrA